ncbi:hypothetical protein pb186bvf_015666 [Paramecium bursaria]
MLQPSGDFIQPVEPNSDVAIKTKLPEENQIQIIHQSHYIDMPQIKQEDQDEKKQLLSDGIFVPDQPFCNRPQLLRCPYCKNVVMSKVEFKAGWGAVCMSLVLILFVLSSPFFFLPCCMRILIIFAPNVRETQVVQILYVIEYFFFSLFNDVCLQFYMKNLKKNINENILFRIIIRIKIMMKCKKQNNERNI